MSLQRQQCLVCDDAAVWEEIVNKQNVFCCPQCQDDFHVMNDRLSLERGGHGFGGGARHGGARIHTHGGHVRPRHSGSHHVTAHGHAMRGAHHGGGRGVYGGRYRRGYFGRGRTGFGYGLYFYSLNPWLYAYWNPYVWYGPRWTPFYTYAITQGGTGEVEYRVNLDLSDRARQSYETLPTLPTFADSGIDIAPLSQYRTAEEAREHEPEIRALKRQLDETLSALRRDYAEETRRTGWTPVPDLDHRRFEWVYKRQ